MKLLIDVNQMHASGDIVRYSCQSWVLFPCFQDCHKWNYMSQWGYFISLFTRQYVAIIVCMLLWSYVPCELCSHSSYILNKHNHFSNYNISHPRYCDRTCLAHDYIRVKEAFRIDVRGPLYKAKVISLFVCSYTIVDYKLEQYFSLTPNQPAVNNPRSFTTKRTCW